MKATQRFISLALMLGLIAGSAAAEGKKSGSKSKDCTCPQAEQMSEQMPDAAAQQEGSADQHQKGKRKESNAKPKQQKQNDDPSWIYAIHG